MPRSTLNHLSEDEQRALDRVRSVAGGNSGKGIPHEEILAGFGWTASSPACFSRRSASARLRSRLRNLGCLVTSF
jgi:hypothetical protein